MTLWIDAQLSPAIASWISSQYDVLAIPLRNLALQHASDRVVFLAARNAGAIVMTKDSDFARLVNEQGPPPQVIWLTCGNTANVHLKEILASTLDRAFELLDSGEPLVEISGT